VLEVVPGIGGLGIDGVVHCLLNLALQVLPCVGKRGVRGEKDRMRGGVVKDCGRLVKE